MKKLLETSEAKNLNTDELKKYISDLENYNSTKVLFNDTVSMDYKLRFRNYIAFIIDIYNEKMSININDILEDRTCGQYYRSK